MIGSPTARALCHLLLADVRERVRRYSFLLTLGLAVLLGYLVCTGKIKLRLGDVRGIYDSAWVGALMALVCNTFLALAGFYVVKSSVERDRATGVGEILATTPITRFQYALGKAASNYVVLLSMASVLLIAAPIGQLLAGEERHIELWPLLSPFLFLVLPSMALVAAMAVLFEMVPGLRSVLGNFIWFFLWTGGIGEAIARRGLPDPFGFARISGDMFAEKAARFGGDDRSFVLGGRGDESATRTFRWHGLDWTLADAGHILLWIGVALAVAFVAALFFDRFDRARSVLPASKRARRKGASEPVPAELGLGLGAGSPRSHSGAVVLTPLGAGGRRFRFFGLLRAEIRLALQGQRWWWYFVLLGLSIAALAAPLDGVRSYVLPFLWIWPIAIWSGIGSRESRFATSPLVFSAARPLLRQLPAAWLAGVVVALGTGAAAGLRFALAGAWVSFGAWVVGALFIPSLALACGAWSGSRKLFEIVYFMLWYIGPLERLPQLDYLGAVAAARAGGMPLVYLALAAGLLFAGVAGRRRQLASDQA